MPCTRQKRALLNGNVALMTTAVLTSRSTSKIREQMTTTSTAYSWVSRMHGHGKVLSGAFINCCMTSLSHCRKYCPWSIPYSAMGGTAFVICMCLMTMTGIVIVCYTAPKPAGVFLLSLPFACSPMKGMKSVWNRVESTDKESSLIRHIDYEDAIRFRFVRWDRVKLH